MDGDRNAPQLQSVVRIPTPEPQRPDPPQPTSSKRKRPSSSRSPSRSPRRRPILKDVDPNRAAERERQLMERFRQRPEESSKPLTDAEKQEKAKEEYQRLLNARSGGTYVPPARLRALQQQVTDKTSKEYQRMAWEALKKSINGLINKVNVSNIKHIVPELFNENLVRGRGLFCRSIMKAQAASLPFTPIYAAMAAIVNTKLPNVGELLMNRLIVQFRKAYKRNDKTVCISSTTFIAHLCNQQVIHEILAAQLLMVLLSNPTDDSVEIAVGITREVGKHLEDMNPRIGATVFDQFRNILHEADIDKRTQYMIEVLFQIRKEKYKDNPAVKEDLDLVEEDDQITHHAPELDATIDTEDGLNIFKYDEKYEQTEKEYQDLKVEILGDGDDDDDGEDDSDESSESEEDQAERALEIKDQTNTDLTNLRRTIYLTINSSADFEECCHKLMKINLPPGQESELPSMIIEACSQRPTYEKFYGLIGERFARLNRLWKDLFEEQFAKYYETIHRYEANRIRNIGRFFGHILGTDAIGWHAMSVIHVTEEKTTSSGRIFIKILFQELSEEMGMKKLQDRLKDPSMQASFEGLLPRDSTRNTRFAINYFTAIGMGPITEDLREFLKNAPKPVVPAITAAAAKADESDSESVSSRSSYSSYTDSSTSSRSRSRSPAKRRDRGRSRSRSQSDSGSRSAPRREKGRRERSQSEDRERDRSNSRDPPRPKTNDKRSRDRSESHSRSRSSSPRARGDDGGQGVKDSRTPPRRNNNTRKASESRSRSPVPRSGRGRRDSASSHSSSSSSSSDSRSRSRSPVHDDRSRSHSPQRHHRDARPQRRSPSRSRSPPRRRDDPPAQRERGGKPSAVKQQARERSLSPYSRRVQMTREQQRGQRGSRA